MADFSAGADRTVAKSGRPVAIGESHAEFVSLSLSVFSACSRRARA
jgi:hypothetical protein